MRNKCGSTVTIDIRPGAEPPELGHVPSDAFRHNADAKKPKSRRTRWRGKARTGQGAGNSEGKSIKNVSSR